MKKISYSIGLCSTLFGVFTGFSQQNVDTVEKTQQIQKYTIMERFEPDLILTAVEREQLKATRFAEIKLKIQILDTMNISERKRERLIEDLVEDPFSDRLSKTLTDITFDNDK